MNWNSIIQVELKEVLATLQDAFTDLDIDYFLIGAVARDIWFADSGKTTRRTKDIDFAIYAGTREEYQAVKKYLKEKKGYQDTRGNVFVLLAPGGLHVDILPFGGIELDRQVHLDGQGLTNIRVNGLLEVFEAGTEKVTQVDGKEFRAASLAGIVLLKLIAYDDRPEKRLKDARDVGNILENYFDLQTDLIYEEHNDLFGTNEADLDQLTLQDVAAEALGREIRKIAQNNQDLLQRIQNIVSRVIREKENSSFIREMVAETSRPVSELIVWLEKLANGLR